MTEIKAKWAALNPPARFLSAGAVAVVGLFLLFKVLPALLGALSLGVIVFILIGPYWAPTITAFLRHHPSKGGVLDLNLFLGWTFIGWVLSLIWALSDNKARGGSQTVIVNNGALPTGPQFQAGDVYNGHRFDGTSWTPELPAPSPAVALDGPEGSR